MGDFSPTQIALFAGAVVALLAWIGLILAPAWASYGRVWEKLAASFLSLYILIALLGVGTAIGVAIVFYYPNLF